MASPTRSVRLRIKRYIPIDEGEIDTTEKDLIFLLNVNRLQKELTDGAEVITYYGRNSVELSFGIAPFTIMVDGWIGNEAKSSDHSAHAIGNPVDGVEHSPDYIDMEEAALYWNHMAGPNADSDFLPQLEIEHGHHEGGLLHRGGFRIYKGLIREMELTRYGAQAAVYFKMLFEVVFDFRGDPGIREWAS